MVELTEPIPITLAYAPSQQQQHYQHLQVTKGTTLIQALQHAGWLDRFADLAEWCAQQEPHAPPKARSWRVGVFAKKQPLDYVLQAHDRVEVYRPLLHNPMQTRRQRARS